jgi:aromatic-L-amino-acid/L-tryptophan decarboxylase
MAHESLDPQDWDAFRAIAHAALDDAIEFLRTVNSRPVWKPVPEQLRNLVDNPVPLLETPFEEVYEEFKETILPYVTGNIHPRFFGWVHGAGQASGIIAEMLSATMNSNCGGRDHGAIYVEKRVLSWCRELFGFPAQSSGLLVSGTSMANLIALGVARNARQEANIRKGGLKNYPRPLVAFASAEVHSSVVKAVELLGLGSDSLREIPVKPDFTIDVQRLRDAIEEERQLGREPFCVVGTAGTVNTGAIDPLDELASLCATEKLWFHVDGAFAALACLNKSLRPRLRGLERADSLAFDFHKWAQVQYDAGCILVRQGDLHRAAFSMHPAYLENSSRGLAAGTDWPSDFGPELSRGFRALKVWFALKEHGAEKIGRVVEQNCDQARYLAELLANETDFELLAPVSLNIVCFGFRCPELDSVELDRINQQIVVDLQESGVAAPSTTRVQGRVAIRVNITNHRTQYSDLEVLVEAALSSARARARTRKAGESP